MKVTLDERGLMRRITKLMSPADAHGEYIGATLIKPAAADALGDGAEGDLGARPRPLLRGRLPDPGRHRRRRGRRADRRRCRGSRSTTTPTSTRAQGDRVPLLARMLLSPLFIDIRAGAVSGLGELLSDRRISADGHVAVAVGPGQGEQSWRRSVRPWTTPTSSRSAAAAWTRRASCRPPCAASTTTRWSASAADARSTSRSTPPPGRRCPWWRSRPTSRTTASRRRSLAAARGRQGLLRCQHADRGGRRPRLRAQLAAPDGAFRHRRRRQQPVGDRRLAARARRARRAGRRPRRAPSRGRRPRRCCTAPTASTRTSSSPPSPRRWCCRAWRWRPPGRAGRPAAPTTRSCTRSTSCSPAPPTTASWPVSGALYSSFLRGNDALAAPDRRLPAPARAAAGCRPTSGSPPEQFTEAVMLAPSHPAGPLHDPRAPRPRRGGDPGDGGRVRRDVRTLTQRRSPRRRRRDLPVIAFPGPWVTRAWWESSGCSGRAGDPSGRPLGEPPRPALLVSRDLKVKYAVVGARLRLDRPRAADDGGRLLVRLHQADGPAPSARTPTSSSCCAAMLPWQWTNGVLRPRCGRCPRTPSWCARPACRARSGCCARSASKFAEFLFAIPVLSPSSPCSPAPSCTGRSSSFPLAVVHPGRPALGAGLILAPLATLYGDVQRLMRIVMRLLFYFSPILYGITTCSEVQGVDRRRLGRRHLLVLNPLAGIFDLYRAAFFPDQFVGWARRGFSVPSSPCSCSASAILVFRRFEGLVLKEI